jgi:hypothetical protein
MPGFNWNVFNFQRRNTRRKTAAGNAGQNGNVLGLLRRDARRRAAAGNADKIKTFLKTLTRRRQLLLLRFTVTSRLFTLMKQKGILVYPFNQISTFR